MPDKATHQGAQQPAEPKTGRAFPEPALPEGVDIPGENSDDTPRAVSPRDAMLADMDSRLDDQRREEIRQEQQELAEAMGQTDEDPSDLEPGLTSKEVIDEEPNEDDELPEGLRNDPLADYIVMDGDKPMFKTKVDGQERLVPLENARAQLQKHVAAEIRLQNAAEKDKELNAREAEIQKNEAALQAKLASAEASPPSVPSDVSDQDLKDEAHQVVSSLFTGTEDEAVEKLTHLLIKTRTVSGPKVDPTEVANQAVQAARKQLDAENAEEAEKARKLDEAAGFEAFSKEYSDILADANLFRYADGLTDSIAEENPNWTPSQVMAEAGKKTREWVESLKGSTSEQDPQPNDRQVRKQNLRPMPRARSAQVQSSSKNDQPDTPQSVMAQVRQSRGQA